MSLAEQITADLTAAMKARDATATATLRMVLAAMKTKAAEPGRDAALADEEVRDLIGREAKRRTESAEAYDEAGRAELAEQERAELEVLRRYLPAPLEASALAALVDEAIAASGAQGPRDLGKVMGRVMPQVRGRADGTAVQALVRDRLGT